MLSQLKEDINSRKEDVGKLVGILKANSSEGDLKNILASSIILAMYNLIEFLTREAVVYVIDDIKYKRTHVLDIKDEIQSNLIDHASTKDKYINLQSLFDKASCKITLNKKKIINGGNVDFKYLKNILKVFAIDENAQSFDIRNESQINLDTLKEARNDLAHGDRSFRESNYTIEQIEEFELYIDMLCINIIDKLENCLNQNLYLKGINS